MLRIRSQGPDGGEGGAFWSTEHAGQWLMSMRAISLCCPRMCCYGRSPAHFRRWRIHTLWYALRLYNPMS